MSESPEKIQKRILEKTQSTVQTQAGAIDQLKRQGQSLEASNRNINALRDQRTAADKDLTHIKKNKNVFKRFLLDYCCCCQCCRNCCEDKTEPVFIAITTESEEPDPDDATVDKLWKRRYEPKTWDQQMDHNLKRLQEDAEDCERELRKQNKLIVKMDDKSRTETIALHRSTQTMLDIQN